MGIFDFVIGIKKKKLKRYIERGAILLDVRNEDEIENGKIEGSQHIPLEQLQERVDELKALTKPVIVYCQSGGRSAKATEYLNLNNVDAIDGGGLQSLKKLL